MNFMSWSDCQTHVIHFPRGCLRASAAASGGSRVEKIKLYDGAYAFDVRAFDFHFSTLILPIQLCFFFGFAMVECCTALVPTVHIP